MYDFFWSGWGQNSDDGTIKHTYIHMWYFCSEGGTTSSEGGTRHAQREERDMLRGRNDTLRLRNDTLI